MRASARFFVEQHPGFSAPPLTVRTLGEAGSARRITNILIANESKSLGGRIGKLFHSTGQRAGSRRTSPGLAPDHVRTDADVVDGDWHYVAMQYAPNRIRLFVDGRLVGDQAVALATDNVLPKIPGELGIGALISRKLGCGGLIDDVRISQGQRDVSKVPDKPHSIDDRTIALWRLDALRNNSAEDATGGDPAKWESGTTAGGAPVRLQRRADQDAIDWAQGFLWADEESRNDDRWNQMQIGPVLASIMQFPSGPVAKGMSIRLGDDGEAAVCYDTERMCVRAGWTGGFLEFDPTRFGLIRSPSPAGDVQFESLEIPGWTGGEIAYRGQHRHGKRIVLDYSVGQTRVLESPWSEQVGGHIAFVRQFEVAAHPGPMILRIGKFGEESRLVDQDGFTIAVSGDDEAAVCVALAGKGASSLEVDVDGHIVATLPDSDQVSRFDVLTWRGDEAQRAQTGAAIVKRGAPASLAPLIQPGKLQWPETLKSEGKLGEEDDAYAVDAVAVPFDNPYGALMFTSGFDFFSDGRAAVSAIHGDVWIVDGLDTDLNAVTWKRFATGLFQPLGVKIVDDEVYVLGRDRITRLKDLNDDGEADFYENFASGYLTSTGGHDYVACLETDPEGNFYFVHGVDGVLRVPPTGGSATVVATGLRNPNGLGVGPQGLVTAAPQEGTWTPVSSIVAVREGNHFGFRGPQVTDERPLGYDPPLCWIPRLMDNSSGGQVWATGNQWGPLSGSMLHLSFGQCRALLTLMEEVDGQWQGGTVSLPWNFQSGVMRGRVHPLDGQMWVSGLKGWTTRAVDDGCLQRIRYTGKPVYLPTGVKHYANGIALTFTSPLDPEIAQDPDSYHGEQWNYLWSEAYGSADYKPSEPGIQGHDPVEIVSATLQPDGRTIFLEIADLAPVMQLKIDYQLKAADGREFGNAYYGTLNRLPATMMPESQIVRVPRQRLPAEIEASLEPGVLVRFGSVDAEGFELDCRVDRLAALSVDALESPSSIASPVSFKARYEGYLKVPLRGDYEFSMEGHGRVRLEINGEEVFSGVGADLSKFRGESVRLRTGFNRIVIDFKSRDGGRGRFRLLWEHEAFAREPVPPTAWFHRGDDAILNAGRPYKDGLELAAALHCNRCHSVRNPVFGAAPWLDLDPPNLHGSGERLNRDWVAQWLLDPKSHRAEATMPALFDLADPQSAQQAADVAAYVVTLGMQEQNVSRETSVARESGETAEVAEVIENGERLYEQFACLACHRFTPPNEEDDYDRVSLAGVSEKYRSGQLAQYLREPQRRHHGTRMPDFQLSPGESDALAALIISKGASDEATTAGLFGNPERGRKLFELKRCGACHATATDGVRPKLPPIALRNSQQGCLSRSEENRGDAPRYAVSAGQVQSLAETFFPGAGLQTFHRDSRADMAELLIRQYNCGACHSRDGEISPRQFLTVEEGSGMIPDALPTLTWTGEKLRTDWLARFLAGERHAPLRPWLKARMPAFPAIADVLADGLRAQHGIAADEPEAFPVDPKLASIGAQLAAPTALDCLQCHGVGGEQPRGDSQTLIALGINFSDSRVRLRREYYDRFLLNPPRSDPGLRMPILAPDGRTTKATKVFGGDAHRQFDALWHYVQSAPPRSAKTAATSE